MGRKRKNDESQGAPEWMVTYGDMMTLLLCFFVMIVAMSEVKKDEKYRVVVESIQTAFGYRGGIGAIPSDVPPQVSPVTRKLAQAAEERDLTKGESPDEGQQGTYIEVRTVRDGMQFVMGGAAAFDEGRAELRPAVHEELLQVGEAIRGYNLKVEIRGHTSRAPLPPESPFADHWDLSYARAKAVAEFLEQRGQIRPTRLRIAGAGGTEPLIAPAYTARDRARNSRVEITVNGSLVEEYQGEPTADAAVAEPAAILPGAIDGA